MKHGYALGQIILAGPSTRYALARELVRLGSKDWTITSAIGAEGLEFETSYVVTILAPIASPAHSFEDRLGCTIELPGNPDAFENNLRYLAENLALTFGQRSVIYHLLPTSFEETTSQATYRRDTPRAEQTAPVTGAYALPAGRHEAQADAMGIDWKAESRAAPAKHEAGPANPDLPEPERGNFGPAVLGDPAAVRAYNQANAHAEPDDDIFF